MCARPPLSSLAATRLWSTSSLFSPISTVSDDDNGTSWTCHTSQLTLLVHPPTGLASYTRPSMTRRKQYQLPSLISITTSTRCSESAPRQSPIPSYTPTPLRSRGTRTSRNFPSLSTLRRPPRFQSLSLTIRGMGRLPQRLTMRSLMKTRPRSSSSSTAFPQRPPHIHHLSNVTCPLPLFRDKILWSPSSMTMVLLWLLPMSQRRRPILSCRHPPHCSISFTRSGTIVRMMRKTIARLRRSVGVLKTRRPSTSARTRAAIRVS